ncbi:MAG: protein kinase [Pirellulaceae bacterium]|nr:protein kinase [Pirellulaceae bacterium]
MSRAGDSPPDFLAVARQLELLSVDACAALAAESQATGLAPRELALRQGVLNPTQIDVVETLCRPREAIPGYEIVGVIGRGGMGVVYRARQLALDRFVALKTVLLSQLADHTALRRFEQEATLAARLSHPNIVAAYDFGKHQGRLYFAMELVAGEDADKRTRRSAGLDEPLAWAIVRQVAAGLAHAHKLGVIHRDIKPSNVLLVEPPAGFPLPAGVPLVKIADFGLARLAEDSDRTQLTSANAALGSPHYMAPEQWERSDIDHRADIYALGATAWHLLIGQAPLAELPLTQLIAHKVRGQVPDVRRERPHISEVSAELIRDMMAVDPRRRPADYAELLRRIDRLGLAGIAPAGGLLAASAPTADFAAGETWPAIRRRASRRWVLAGAALLAGMIAVGGVAWLWPDSSPGQPDLVVAGRAGNLFDGLAIDEWRPQSGGWSPARNADRADVLQGTGVVRRAISLPDAEGKSTPVPYYRLTLFVQLHEATAAEVHFDLAAPSSKAERQVVRLTSAGSQLGRRAGDAGELSRLGPVLPFELPATAVHVVVVERHTGGWWVTVDEQSLGGRRGLFADPAPEFRLRAEGGPAWFSDVSVEELLPPAGPAPLGR